MTPITVDGLDGEFTVESFDGTLITLRSNAAGRLRGGAAGRARGGVSDYARSIAALPTARTTICAHSLVPIGMCAYERGGTAQTQETAEPQLAHPLALLLLQIAPLSPVLPAPSRKIRR